MQRSGLLAVRDLRLPFLNSLGLIERRFGDLKNHFQVLSDGFDFNPVYFQTIFRICIALHNLIADPALYSLPVAPASFYDSSDDSDLSVGAVFTAEPVISGR